MLSALVLLSGGQDSTIALYWAKQHFSPVHAVSFDYGQRHSVELTSARTIASMAQVPHTVIPIDVFTLLADSALVGLGSVNEAHQRDDNLPASFVPGRNLFFLIVASMVAYKEGIRDIVIGVSETDYSGYPDCRLETIQAMQSAVSLGMGTDFVFHTPLISMSKMSEVLLAQELDGCMDALAFSHTCYNGKVPPCGTCPACMLRCKGFHEAGVVDPLIRRCNEH